MNVWVVVPTYNERGNIPELLRRVFALPITRLSVLVVDDNSPDGTSDVVAQLRASYPALVLLRRPAKGGLASAYVDGFRVALDHGAEYIFEIDADLSHPPEMIPALLERAAQSADLVLGSRYIPGGEVVNWNWPRRMVSRFGNWYARTVLAIPVHDVTGGFKCFRRNVLVDLDLNTVTSTGYNFQIELTCKALQAGFRVAELPITFTERQQGRSKFHVGIILESMIGVWKLRQLRFSARRPSPKI